MLDTFEPVVQPSIRLESFHLAELKFHLDPKHWEKHELSETEFKVNFSHIQKDTNPNYFGLFFKIFIQNSDQSIDLNFNFIGHFETIGLEINDEVLENNNFFKYSAPAIVFPYIRSFVSNFMLNSGFKPIILPSLNFTQLKRVED